MDRQLAIYTGKYLFESMVSFFAVVASRHSAHCIPVSEVNELFCFAGANYNFAS